MSAWVKFNGSATKSHSATILRSSSGKGVLEVDTGSVRVTGSNVEIRVGSVVRVLEYPLGNRPATQPVTPDETVLPNCEATTCLGMIKICCGSGVVLGRCLGAWGCVPTATPSAPPIPYPTPTSVPRI